MWGVSVCPSLTHSISNWKTENVTKIDLLQSDMFCLQVRKHERRAKGAKPCICHYKLMCLATIATKLIIFTFGGVLIKWALTKMRLVLTKIGGSNDVNVPYSVMEIYRRIYFTCSYLYLFVTFGSSFLAKQNNSSHTRRTLPLLRAAWPNTAMASKSAVLQCLTNWRFVSAEPTNEQMTIPQQKHKIQSPNSWSKTFEKLDRKPTVGDQTYSFCNVFMKFFCVLMNLAIGEKQFGIWTPLSQPDFYWSAVGPKLGHYATMLPGVKPKRNRVG